MKTSKKYEDDEERIPGSGEDNLSEGGVTSHDDNQ